jgi:hypothetical protein
LKSFFKGFNQALTHDFTLQLHPRFLLWVSKIIRNGIIGFFSLIIVVVSLQVIDGGFSPGVAF